MTLTFHLQAWDDYQYWQHNDKALLRKVNQLIRDVQRDPFCGLGKPEALKGDLSGLWSRRVTDAYRLVYVIEGDDLVVLQCCGHHD